MNIATRIGALERSTAAHALFVVFPSTPQEAIEDAKRSGRPMVMWPIDPPPIESRGPDAKAGVDARIEGKRQA